MNPDPRVPDGFMDDPPPQPRRRGCLPWVVALSVAVFLLACSAPVPPTQVPTPSEARHSVASLTDDGLRGAPDRPRPSRQPVGTGAPQPTGGIGTALVGGFATWYEDPRQSQPYYAAAGPLIREALGPDWRHTLIEVQGPARFSVIVELVDACACGPRHGLPTLLDLSPAAFRELAPLSAGVVAVSIELVPALPATDADVRMMLEVRDDTLYSTEGSRNER